ncbi:hedgehog-interacting protein isoform X2 [Mustelus asterias]
MKMNAKVSLKFVLVLVVAANLFDSEAKSRERSEKSPVRRCLDGSAPRRLKKRDRRLLALDASGYICHKLYTRLSCCPVSRQQFVDPQVFSVTNNTECARLLEEIKCAQCSPYAQNLFHLPDQEEASNNELDFPILCRDYCKQFYFACRSHIAGLFQTTSDEFCNLYSAKNNGMCFPDSPRKQVQGPASNYLNQMDEYHKMEQINRKHKKNCYCLHEMISGLKQPIGLVHCGDGSQRLFILEKEGFVKIYTADGELLKESFLDIHKQVQSGIKGGDERGLLSLAFHPKFNENGKLYVSYTTNQERWAIGPHDHILRVVEYTVSRKNANQVDTRTAKVLTEVAELHRKHLGGQLLFGPDNFLYIFLGDGMITLDDMEEMDGLSDFTGSVLRIDVDTDSCNAPYVIPRSNPYFNSTNQPPEIFAHGLHNPGRALVPEECKRSVQPPQPVASECSRHCRNGHCTPTGKCCCSPGWEEEFCRVAKCDPVCRHGGVCVRPNMCLCKESYTGPQCEQVDRNIQRVARAAVCQQLRKGGNCNTPTRRWFFNVDTRQCEQFLYSGCQGNKNRFSSQEECIKTCLLRSHQGTGLIQGMDK